MTITTAVAIDRAPEEVFGYVTDPSRFAEWQQGVVSGQMDGQGPHGVGARWLTTRRQVTIDLDFVGHGIGKLLVPLMVRPQARREMVGNPQRLKERLEWGNRD